MSFAEENHPVGRFPSKRPVETLQMRVAVWGAGWSSHRLNSRLSKQPPKVRMEERIAIHDQKPLPVQKTRDRIREVSVNLLRPCGIGMRCDTGANHLPRRQFHHECDVVRHQAAHRPDFDRRKIYCCQSSPLGFQKRQSRSSATSFRRRLQSRLFQDVCHSGSAHPMPEIAEPILDARVTPAWFGPRHLQYQFANFRRNLRAPYPAAWESPFQGD